MKPATLFFSLACFLASPALSQGVAEWGLQYSKPFSELLEEGYSPGIGSYLSLWTGPSLRGAAMSFHAGLRGDFSWNGRKMEKVTVDPAGVRANYTLDNWQFGTYAALRLSPNTGAQFVPYLDAYGGARFFGSNISLTIRDVNSPDNYESLFSIWPVQTWAWSYGFGAGFQYWVSPCVALDLRTVWLTTARPLDYIPLSTVSMGEIAYEYQIANTRAPMGLIHAGLTFSLSRNCNGCGPDGNSADPGRREYPDGSIRTHPGYQPLRSGARPSPAYRPTRASNLGGESY